MYRKIFVANDTGDLIINLPEEYLHKEVEVIAFEVNQKTKSLIEQKQKEALVAVEYFKGIAVDMSNFKFNREDANER